MKPPRHSASARPEGRHVAQWLSGRGDVSARTLARLLGTGLVCMTLALAGGLLLEVSPWATLALPAGAALALMARWGRVVLLGAASGVLLALVATGQPLASALFSVAVIA
ncbi:MAG: hypothetical protein H7Z19_20865, partial [Chitinophagaceae bacterium]|nr:hypothetical protein [Rubrivivax sp.]